MNTKKYKGEGTRVEHVNLLRAGTASPEDRTGRKRTRQVTGKGSFFFLIKQKTITQKSKMIPIKKGRVRSKERK